MMFKILAFLFLATLGSLGKLKALLNNKVWFNLWNVYNLLNWHIWQL